MLANGNVAPNALTQAQGSVVQGTVKDGTGEPLIGVSVVVKGATGLGVVTDIDGNYKSTLRTRTLFWCSPLHRLHTAGGKDRRSCKRRCNHEGRELSAQGGRSNRHGYQA